jgi:hypothetical protein
VRDKLLKVGVCLIGPLPVLGASLSMLGSVGSVAACVALVTLSSLQPIAWQGRCDESWQLCDEGVIYRSAEGSLQSLAGL